MTATTVLPQPGGGDLNSDGAGGREGVASAMTPRKLNVDEDDEDMSLLQGGPFENAKRKNSWSATSMRKELGSPRMATSEYTHGHAGFDLDGSQQQQQQQQQHAQHSHAQVVPQNGGVSSQKKERSCMRNGGPSFLQELGSALVSCGGGTRGRTQNPNSNSSNNSRNGVAPSPSDLMDVANSWVRLKDTFAKAVGGDLDAAKDAWKKEDFPIQTVPSHDSILTYDNHSILNQKQAYLLQQEEEAMQLRRLTSWGTVGTYDTAETFGTGPPRPVKGNVLEDDDGIPIDVQLLQTRGGKKLMDQGKLSKPSEPRRKRVVRFDYPPISSLRECPRTQPDQIENLFFTEHELEQIEDDRYSTISADDVEIVAISTSTTAESESNEDTHGRHHSRNATSQDTEQSSLDDGRDENRNGNAGNAKHKKDQRKGRRNFSFDDGGRGSAVVNTAANKNKSRRRRPNNDAHSSKASPTNSASSRRMIKSVQIYLRERSVG